MKNLPYKYIWVKYESSEVLEHARDLRKGLSQRYDN